MSSPSQNHHNYLSRVANAASTPKLEAILKTSSKLGANTTRTCLVIEDGSSARTQTLNTPAEVFNAAAENLSYSRKIVCIVENISSEYIGSLGFAWDIDPGFFVQHAENPRREDLWVPKEFELDGSRANFSCIDGNFEYHGLEVNNDKELNFRPNRFERYCYKTTWEGVETIASNTRISYCRVMELFYLFLVDAPLDIQKRYSGLSRHLRPSLRLPYAENRGGLQLQPLFELRDKEEMHYSLFESLKSVFLHGWPRTVLFVSANGPNIQGADLVVLPPSPLCYILSNSLARTNYRYLSQEITRVSFQDIRDPDFKINEILHDRREDLYAFKKSLSETIVYVPTNVDSFLSAIQAHVWPDQTWTICMTESHKRTLNDADELKTFLMETFQLLLSSISVQDAKMSVKQGQLSNQQSLRATQLTILASIYAPLSFVVGIYGMNVKQLNATGPSIWVFFVTLAIAGTLTVVLYLGFELRSRKIHQRK